MRVLQLIDSLNPGGAERMAVNVANQLANSGHKSYLVTTRAEGLLKTDINNEVDYVFLGKRAALDIQALWKLSKIVNNNHIDIVHAHATSFFFGTLLKLFCPKIKLIWHDHYGNSEELSKRPFRLLRVCSKYFTTIFCVNQLLFDWNKEKLLTNNVIYLPNFIVEDNASNKIQGLPGMEGKRLLCVANLRPQKDHNTLLRAFKVILEEHPLWTLHCVGHDFEDEYSKEIKKLVNDLDLKSNVFLYGSREDVRSIMKSCDIGLLTSMSEGLPLVLLEYGLCGMAVISTDVGDCSKVVLPNYSGILIPPKNENELKTAIITLIENSQMRHNLSEGLKKHVLETFGPNAAMKILYLGYTKE